MEVFRKILFFLMWIVFFIVFLYLFFSIYCLLDVLKLIRSECFVDMSFFDLDDIRID